MIYWVRGVGCISPGLSSSCLLLLKGPNVTLRDKPAIRPLDGCCEEMLPKDLQVLNLLRQPGLLVPAAGPSISEEEAAVLTTHPSAQLNSVK